MACENFICDTSYMTAGFEAIMSTRITRLRGGFRGVSVVPRNYSDSLKLIYFKFKILYNAHNEQRDSI